MVSVGLGGAGQRICFSNEVLFNFFKTYYFVLGYSRLTNNVIIVSGEQRRNSVIYPFSPEFPSHTGCHVTLNRVPRAARYTKNKDFWMESVHRPREGPSGLITPATVSKLRASLRWETSWKQDKDLNYVWSSRVKGGGMLRHLSSFPGKLAPWKELPYEQGRQHSQLLIGVRRFN